MHEAHRLAAWRGCLPRADRLLLRGEGVCLLHCVVPIDFETACAWTDPGYPTYEMIEQRTSECHECPTEACGVNPYYQINYDVKLRKCNSLDDGDIVCMNFSTTGQCCSSKQQGASCFYVFY